MGQTPLLFCAAKGDITITKAILSKDANIDDANKVTNQQEIGGESKSDMILTYHLNIWRSTDFYKYDDLANIIFIQHKFNYT